MSVKRQLEREMYKGKKETSGSAIGFQSYTMLPYEYNNQALISLTVNDIRLLNVLLHKLQCKREKGKYIRGRSKFCVTELNRQRMVKASLKVNGQLRQS